MNDDNVDAPVDWAPHAAKWLRIRAAGFRAMKNETADLFAAALENAAESLERDDDE